jgi:hypothetical protein
MKGAKQLSKLTKTKIMTASEMVLGFLLEMSTCTTFMISILQNYSSVTRINFSHLVRIYLVVVDILIVDCHMYPEESCLPSHVLSYIPAEASMQYIHPVIPIPPFYMVSRD